MAIVRNQAELKAAVSNMEPEILIENDIGMTSPTSIGYALYMRGGPGVSLFWENPVAANRSMFIITAAGALTIEALTLDGEGRDGTLVEIRGGGFTMNRDAVLKNIRSTTAQSAVKIASLTSDVGGSLVMNGGLITGIDTSDAVFCSGGTIFMGDDAAISGNLAAGVTMTAPAGSARRSALTMTGRARVSQNYSKQSGGAGIIVNSDVIMGTGADDAPSVAGNRTDYYCGAWFLTDDSSLTMRDKAEIADNYAALFAGGVGAQDARISITGDAVVAGNESGGAGGGLFLSSGVTAVLGGGARISDNTAGDAGGGVYLQNGATLQVKESAAIHGNSASRGGGVCLNAAAAAVGPGNTAPAIFGNRAAEKGGGVFVSAGSSLALMGRADVRDNDAAEGRGIYKAGTLELSQSPRITDGLFFDSLMPGEASVLPAASAGAPAERPLLLEGTEGRRSVSPLAVAETARSFVSAAGTAAEVPVIVAPLTDSAYILLEESGYVNPANVPVIIADRGADYARLEEPDRAAWHIPPVFGEAYSVLLTDGLDHVVIDYTVFNIYYVGTFAPVNPNPTSYRASDLPLPLLDLPPWEGYAFVGWFDENGNRVTEIPAGTTGDISLTAMWKALSLHFDGNAENASNLPPEIPAGQGGTAAIPFIIPYRPCYCFSHWNTSADGTGVSYDPYDEISLAQGGITLYAQWVPLCCMRCARTPGTPLYCPGCGRR